MKINQIIINEMTTAGAVATVAKPMGETQKRPEVAGLKPVDKVAKAKKKGPYANSLVEGQMKDIDIAKQDYQRMTPQQFYAAYKMTKQQWYEKNKQLLQQKPVQEAKKKDFLGKLQKNVDKANKAKKDTEEKVKQHQNQQDDKKKVEEAKLDEDDIIVVPGSKMKRKTGFVQHGQSRVDHEVEMARSDVLATMKNAKAIYQLLKDRSEDEGIEGWVQEKLIKANDYLNAVKEYYDEKMMQEMTGGVIASGMPGESVAEGSPRQHSGPFKRGIDDLERAMNDLIQTDPEERKQQQQTVKQKLKTKPMAGPKGPLPEQGVAEGVKLTPDMIAKMNQKHQDFYKKNPHMTTGKDITTMAPGAMATKVTPTLNKPAPVKKKPMTPFGSGNLEEKAVSKAQQRFMGMAHAMQKGKKIPGASKELKDVAKGMTKKAGHEFAATKHKGLPEKVKKD